MVIYGNTAEDLGQFNIEVDLDSSLTDTVSAVEGNVEDLPPAFHSRMLTIEELVSPLKILSQAVVKSDIPLELRKFLLLVFKILDSPNVGLAADNVISSLLSVTSTYRTSCSSHKILEQKQVGFEVSRSGEDTSQTLIEAEKELLDLYRMLQSQPGDPSAESSEECSFLESEEDYPTSKELMDTLQRRFDFYCTDGNVGYKHLSRVGGICTLNNIYGIHPYPEISIRSHPQFSSLSVSCISVPSSVPFKVDFASTFCLQNKNAIFWSMVALLLCSARESCFHFVNYGGMKQLVYILTHRIHNSTSLTLLLLGAIEQATMHSVGCEAFLGWWPREDGNIPAGTSDGYNQLLKLLVDNQRHDVASLATSILQRIRFYEVACRYEVHLSNIIFVTTLSKYTYMQAVYLNNLTRADKYKHLKL